MLFPGVKFFLFQSDSWVAQYDMLSNCHVQVYGIENCETSNHMKLHNFLNAIVDEQHNRTMTGFMSLTTPVPAVQGNSCHRISLFHNILLSLKDKLAVLY